MASFVPLAAGNSALPIIQSDHLGLTTHPATKLGSRRQRRRLEYVKCDFCRQSKKKCEPSTRQWPGEKCQRCDAKGVSCSAPTKKNKGGSDAVCSVDNNELLSTPDVLEASSNLRILWSAINASLPQPRNLLHEQIAYCALAEKCMQQMRSGLKINICELSTVNTEIGTIHRSHIDDVIPEELQYACKYWAFHLTRGRDKFLADIELQGLLYNFLTSSFLCWLEALSLLQLIEDGINSIEILKCLANKMEVTASEKLRVFLCDALTFILMYRVDIEDFPLNVYFYAQRSSRLGLMKEIHIPTVPVLIDSHCGEVWGSPTAPLDGRTEPICEIAFSADGQLLATASLDKMVSLWHLATRKRLRVISHATIARAIAFSPDGNILACAWNGGCYSQVKLWDPATGKELQTQSPFWNPAWITSIAFSPDGKLLVSSYSSGVVSIYNPATGCLLHDFHHDDRNYRDYIRASSVAFSPDGKLLASAWENGVIKLFDPHTGSEIRTLVARIKDACDIAFSPNGQMLASASFENTVTIWGLATGIERQISGGDRHAGKPSIAFSPDSKLLASTLFTVDTITLWDPTTGSRQGMLSRRRSCAARIAFSPDGNLLASAAHRGVDLWRLHGHK